jgi:hypothetical protein
VSITGVDSLAAGIIGVPQPWGKDAATAKSAGVPHTLWYGTGLTGAGAAPTGGLNGVTFSGAVAGQVPVPAAVSGLTSRILRASAVHAGNAGLLWIVDRIWGNVPVVTTTGGQAVVSPTWPARDASASTAGSKILLALECSSATGNAGAITNTTVSYTNAAGTAGRTATLASFPATAPAGTFVPLSLAAGDDGVRSVQTVTLGSSYVSGAVHLVAYRLVASIPIPAANVATDRNFTALGLPTVWDSSVLQLVVWPSGTALGAMAGDLSYVQA